MRIAYNPVGKGAISTLPSSYENDIVFDLSGLAIYAKGVKFKGTDTTYNVFKKHSSGDAGGENGLVPVPSYNNNSKTRFLREDGTWVIPTDNKVQQSPDSSSEYRPLLFGYNKNSNASSIGTDTTNITYINTALYVKPSTGSLYATTFEGTTFKGTTFSGTTFEGDLKGTINTSTTAVTQQQTDNSTKVATTAYVRTAINNLINSAPGTLDTLGEIAKFLQDSNVTDGLVNLLAQKINRAGDTMDGELKVTTLGATSNSSFIAKPDSNNGMAFDSNGIHPVTSAQYSLGTSSLKWDKAYANTFIGDLTGTADVAKKLGTTNKGSKTRGIYLALGVANEMTHYLEATVKEATPWGIAYYSAKDNITSTAAGNSGQILISKGNAAPEWLNQAALNPGITITSSKTSNISITVGASTHYVNDLYATFDDQGRNIANTYVTLAGDESITGAKTFTKQASFTVNTTNTAPFTVTSSYVVANLNADLLDGYNANELFESLTNNGNKIKIQIGNNPKELTVNYATNAGTMPYTGLTGSTTTKNQAILSTGTANGWTLKTLGDRAFDSTNYLPIAGGTLTGPLTAQNITPSSNNTYSLGTSSLKWKEVYATTFYGNATTASAWATARTIKIDGAVTGQLTGVDGSGDITITTSVNHTHNYASKVKVNGTDYSVSSNRITIPDYPDETLTIKLNGTSALEYNGYESKEININWSNVGAAELGHTHKYAGSSSVGGAATSALQANNADTVDNYHIAVVNSSATMTDTSTIYFVI